jgi:hypothetical protein
VITRRLVEQRNTRAALEMRRLAGSEWHAYGAGGPGNGGGVGGGAGGEGNSAGAGAGEESGSYFYDDGAGAGGSFRVGIGDKRRSWLGLPQFPSTRDGDGDGQENPRKRGPCCT